MELGWNEKGRIEVITGPMFSGKTSELLRRLQRIRIAEIPFILVKPRQDTRYGHSSVSTHDGGKGEEANVIVHELKSVDVSAVKVILVDEAGFFPDVVEVAREWADSGKVVIAATIDTDYTRMPFGRVAELLAESESVQKLTSVCSFCKNDASYTLRKSTSPRVGENATAGVRILLGGAETYMAACRDCHKKHSGGDLT
jgi:thymidine kinase